MKDDSTAPSFSPIQAGRASEQIVERVKDAIRQGHFSIGQQLPAERELTEQFNVSRVAVRDALRVLEARGLIEIRLGAHGGAYVTAPAPQLVSEGIAHMFMLSDLDFEEVTEARQVVELALIPLVCQRADEHDLRDLQAICDRAEAALADETFEVGISAEFHVRLARAAHNRAVKLMSEALHGPLLSSLQRARAIAPQMGRRGVLEHRAIVEAVQARDTARATAVMTEHLGRTARRLRNTKADFAGADTRE